MPIRHIRSRAILENTISLLHIRLTADSSLTVGRRYRQTQFNAGWAKISQFERR